MKLARSDRHLPDMMNFMNNNMMQNGINRMPIAAVNYDLLWVIFRR